MTVIRNSMRQLRRTPLRACLFILLLMFASLLLSLGGSLNLLTDSNIQRLEKVFMTIGTVEQTPFAVVRRQTWDAEVKDYIFRDRKEYGKSIPLSALDIEGAEYLSGPERRPYFLSYDPSYKIAQEATGFTCITILEAEPYEDCVPAGPVKMKVNRILYSYYPIHNMIDFYFCDHNNPEPEMLYAGKSYIMYLMDGLPHGWRRSQSGNYEWEWVPAGTVSSNQAGLTGEAVPNSLSNLYYEEVTDGFYETEHGKAWLELVKTVDWHYHSVPVTPVSDLNLLMAFYNGDAYVIEGRAFEQADYEEGRKVCMISRYFARNNGLKAGGRLPLSMVLASYQGSSASDVFCMFSPDYGCLNADGRAYEPFEEGDYTIIGIYDRSPGASGRGDYALADNEVLIPAGAAGSYGQNIAAYGPVKASNTSFRIPNGTIEKYRKLWEEQGVEGLEIQFYDKGYTQLKENINSIRRISVVLLLAGVITALLVLVFFCHLLITKQGKRTAIERSLGMSRRQCIVSLLTGILLLAAAGSFAGSAAGCRLTGEVVGRMEAGGHYDTRYSNGIMGVEGNNEEAIVLDASANKAVTAASGGGLFIMAFLISFGMAVGNLKKEPLELLGKREE